MTVRGITKTTLSVSILITGFVFFKKYYAVLLSKLLQLFFPDKELAPVIFGRLFPKEYIGSYFPSLFFFCVIIIIIALILDVILSHKAGLKVLSPFISPLILTVIITTALCIEKLNLLQLWAIFYFWILICLHSTFKKIIIYSESVGDYPNLKLIKGFFITIKDAVSNVISTGIGGFRNPVDEIIILLISAATLLLEVIVFISYIIYLLMYWRLIFLAHLINAV
jgi:hypothetical protein